MRIRGTLVLAGISACGGGGGGTDIAPTLVFAERSDAEINRLITAATGSDMFGAQSQVDQFGDTFDPDPCPTITIEGNTATVTGDCTTADGTLMIEGSAEVTNPQSWDQIEWEPGVDSEYHIDGLAFVYTGFTQTYDGAIRVGSDFQSWDADITVGSLDVVVRSDVHYRCSTTSCSLTGSGVELVGVGGAQAAGTVTVAGDTVTAEYTLRGVDTLHVTMDGSCVSWEIEGTDRRFDCPQQ
jgi:hypothetical protein